MIDLSIFTESRLGWAALWLIVYTVLLSIYFGQGAIMVLLNRHHPERRIQDVRRSSRDRADIRQSVKSLALISLLVTGGLYLPAAGFALFAPASATAVSVAGFLLLSFVLYDTWFYWGHRAMHTKALFRFHKLHHRSITPTTWSNNSDSLVGAAIEQGYFLVAPLLLPIPADVIIIHNLFDQVTGMISHCGFEYFAGPASRTPWPGLCTVFHDQHHLNFRCNYGNTFSLWDRFMGTLHSSYDRKVQDFERIAAGSNERKKVSE